MTTTYRVEIDNVKRHTPANKFKKLLTDLGVQYTKLVVVPGRTHASFLVDSLENQKKYVELLQGASLKGNTLEVKAGIAVVKVEEENRKEDGVQKPPPIIQDMFSTTAPLYLTPYESQLTIKYTKATELFTKMCDSISAVALAQRPKDTKFYGTFNQIVPSPAVQGYRNKCEFTCGVTPEGTRIAGFQSGAFRRGFNFVFPVDDCIHVSNGMKHVARVFSTEILQKSPQSVYSLDTNSGFWKIVCVRQYTLDLMIIVTVDPTGISEEDIEIAKNSLRECFIDSANEISVTSLYFATQQTSSQTPTLYLLGGAPYVYERLMGLSFRISPSSFFQPNTLGAGKLYETIASMTQINQDTVLLDLCCGTGTIGISLANRVKFVLGVEICKEAVEDATITAKDNGLSDRCKFICSPVENVASSLISLLPKECAGAQIVAILDPPRAGVHDSVIKAVRKLETLDKLVYVSCDPAAAQKNVIDLCRITSNKYPWYPFKIDQVTPVDMLPHTYMTEWVIAMSRLK